MACALWCTSVSPLPVTGSPVYTADSPRLFEQDLKKHMPAGGMVVVLAAMSKGMRGD